jgi:CBS domain-containing protein
MHIAAEATEHNMEAAGGAARRGAQVVSEGTREIMEAGADKIGAVSGKMAQAAQQSIADLQTLMRLPGFGGGVEQLHQAAMSMMTHVVQANVRATQEVLRASNPGALVEMQQRFVQHYLSGLIEGSAEVLRVSRNLADCALKPIEERAQRLQQRRVSGHHDNETSKISDVMTANVEIAKPDQSVQEAAKLMAEIDAGALPVGEDDRLVGMITDRDIAVRVTAEGKDPKQTRVREVMTQGVRYCFEDEPVEGVAENMAEQQVHKLPVMNRDNRIVGVVSLGDVANTQPQQFSGTALRGISQRAGRRAYAGNRPQMGGGDAGE